MKKIFLVLLLLIVSVFALSSCMDANQLNNIPDSKRQGLIGILSHDPRPSYQEDSERVYGLNFAGANIRFTIKANILTITEIEKETKEGTL